MPAIIALILLILAVSPASAQHVLKIKIIDGHSKEPLAGATLHIYPPDKTTVSDSTGVGVFTGLAAGKYRISVSFKGFERRQSEVIISNKDELLEFELEPHVEEEEEIIVQSTRSTRTFRDIPTRIEFIAGEELDEKSNMKPGDIRMVLNESTGIQTQQTSATSGNASIRIQGLDGRYTQILKDGFPLYSGFSGGLGLLQTPPLDLKQFEVIKGSASTLHGGGAIAGLVNLISKTPGEEKELKFHIDLTTAGGVNTSGFYGQRFKKTGITFFASRNSNAAYDPSSTGLTAIPKFERYTINPRFYFYLNEKTEFDLGLNLSFEDRKGGDIDYLKNKKPSGYFEDNKSDRISTQLRFERKYGKTGSLVFKNSLSRFKREINIPAYFFNGTQYASFTEATYSNHGEDLEWIAGLNVVTDKFKESNNGISSLRDYQLVTWGAFFQNTFRVREMIHIETGLRGDYVEDYGFAALPRLSVLLRFTPELTSRIGGGLGYKPPVIFTEEGERLLFRNVLPIHIDSNKLEKSYGVNADINYKTKIADGEIDLSINQLFFYTRISDPLLLFPIGSDYRFRNVPGHIDSRGLETNIRIGYDDFKLFLGYTWTEAYLHQGNYRQHNYLTPRHRLNSVLLYEVHEKFKAGLEAYYFSDQELSDGAKGKSYWITGFMMEKIWENFSLYLNFENFLDTRQTKFDSIYTGTLENPVFRDIYAPLDGFVVNGGIKLNF